MARAPRKARKAPRRRSLAATARLLVGLAIAALLLRSLVVAPFSIPSGSMLPSLMVGDYLLVAKWSYGWSRYSLPLSPPLFSGRILDLAPERGDVVVFRNPADPATSYVKRVIGLPGDTVRLRDGEVVLNGARVPRLRVADLLVPVTPNSPCQVGPALTVQREREEDGSPACRYRRYRETLPGGRSYDVLDIEAGSEGDETPAFHVPEGHYFLLGDNRDRSADSRFAASPAGGIGFVPAENLVGRALVLFYSTDGSATWARPWTWWSAARRERIGAGL